jgi:hypothetical protein
MSTETLYATSLVSGTVSTPANALGAPNNTWTSDTGNVSWTARFAMANPVGTQANGTHTITIRARKVSGQSGSPTISSVTLYENGTSFATVSTGGFSITTTSQDVANTFDSALLAGRNLADIEIEVVTSAAGGSPSTRTPVQIDSITWNGDFTTPAVPVFEQSVGVPVSDA